MMIIPGIEIPKVKRNAYSFWVRPIEESGMYQVCRECGTASYSRPTKFCGECGALMINFEAADADYDSFYNMLGESASKEPSEGGEAE